MQNLILSLLVGLLLSCSCHGDENGDAQKSPSTLQSQSTDEQDGSEQNIHGASNAQSHAQSGESQNLAHKDLSSQSDLKDLSNFLSNTITKRAAFWIPEVIGKRNPAALEKRSVSLYDRGDDEMNEDEDGPLFQVMRRIPKFVGKRIPKFVGKRIPKFVGKRIPKFVGKRIPKFVGKRQRIPKFVGKRIPKFVGKRIPKFVGKRIPKFVGKRMYDDVADEYMEGLKELLEGNADKRIPKFVGKRDGSQEQDTNDLQKSEIESQHKVQRQRRSLYEKRAWGHMIPWYDMEAIYRNANHGPAYGEIPSLRKRFIAPQFIGKRDMTGSELWLDALRQLEEIRSKPKRFKPPLFLGKRSEHSLDDLFTDNVYADGFREKRSTDDAAVQDAGH